MPYRIWSDPSRNPSFLSPSPPFCFLVRIPGPPQRTASCQPGLAPGSSGSSESPPPPSPPRPKTIMESARITRRSLPSVVSKEAFSIQHSEKLLFPLLQVHSRNLPRIFRNLPSRPSAPNTSLKIKLSGFPNRIETEPKYQLSEKAERSSFYVLLQNGVLSVLLFCNPSDIRISQAGFSASLDVFCRDGIGRWKISRSLSSAFWYLESRHR